MEESLISQLISYSNVIDKDDYVDYAIQSGAVDQDVYKSIWNLSEVQLKSQLRYILADKGNNFIESVLKFIVDNVPNIQEIADDHDNFRKSTIYGNFPKLPTNYVKRQDLAFKLKQLLTNLNWNETLVVSGMMGYGKSCLVNEVLNDIILRKTFDNKIFWINLGEHHNLETILQTMWNFYVKICECPNKAYRPENVNVLRDKLKNIFLKPPLKNALVILDDVCNSEVLDMFDIGCRRVVTTQDRKILKNGATSSLEVKVGFSLEETLELFKLSLNTKDDLPASAEEIYRISKGHPMLIALIASYLSENRDVSANEHDIWDYIKEMFSRGDYRLNDYDEDVNDPTEKIKTCVDKLLGNKTLKSRYKDLAIFMLDVNIPPKVLEILWNATPIDVRNTMNKFSEKSLIVPFYHDNQQTFIYGIHDIHLKYLKEETKYIIQFIHKRLIDGYDRLTNGDYSLLPKDNYSFLFIGYHLCQAYDYDRFDIYFNLQFLEAKIKAVGKDDVLTDLDQYREYITKQDENLVHRWEEIKNFVIKYGGNLYNFLKTNIVQYALQESKDSYIYNHAITYVRSCKHLYFDFKRPVGVDLDDFHRLHSGDDITYACFVNSAKHILVAFSSGDIKLFYERSEKEVSCFIGNKSQIKQLVVSPDKKYFLSVDEDGDVKFWKINDNGRHSLDAVSSPKTTQADWQDLFSPDGGKIRPRRIFRQPDDKLVSAAFSNKFPELYCIITGSQKGLCIIWDLQTEANLFQTIPRGYEISYVCFSSPQFIFCYDDMISLYDYTIEGGKFNAEFNCTLYNKYKVNAFYQKKQEIIAVSHKNIRLWNVNDKSHTDYKINVNSEDRCLYQVMTSDSSYLIVSMEGGKIYFWDVENMEITRELKSKGLVKSLDTFYDEHKAFHILLIGSDKKTLQQCYIYPNQDESELCYIRTPPFIASWKKNMPFFPLVSCPGDKIQIYRSYSLISETDKINVEISRLCLSACTNYVIYGLINGEIHLFNIRTKLTTPLPPIENRGSIKFLSCYCMDNYSSLQLLDNFNRILDLNSNSLIYGGVIVAICENNYLSVHKNQHLLILSSINNPMVFPKGNQLLFVEHECKIRKLDLRTNTFIEFETDNILATLSSAAFCVQKNVLLMGSKRRKSYYLDLMQLTDNENEHRARLKESYELNDATKSCAISPDGGVVVAGFANGDIWVWDTHTGRRTCLQDCHSDSVEQLMFCPAINPPILVSQSEELSWWNLESIKTKNKPVRTSRKPPSIGILDASENQCNMDIGFWSSRTPIEGDFLLSCLRLSAKPIYVSASSDFNTFLVLDEKGKVYIVERLDDG